jgi:hypothetical protein
MRFLMKTLLARSASRLIHASPASPLWIRSALAAVFVFPAKPRTMGVAGGVGSSGGRGIFGRGRVGDVGGDGGVAGSGDALIFI